MPLGMGSTIKCSTEILPEEPDSLMSFVYHRTIRFQDTDAAGVVYFANVLSICHEAYEASLAATGTDLKAFFTQGLIAVPIVHAHIDFMQPLFCGEVYHVEVTPHALSDSKFETTYRVTASTNADKTYSQATMRHVCIDTTTRTPTSFPQFLRHWLRTHHASVSESH